MSVLLINRGLSELEFYHNAVKLYDDMTNLFLRNFSIKSKTRPVISEAEKEAVLNDYPFMERVFRRLEKLEQAEVVHEYPSWLIEHYRVRMLAELDALLDNITDANTIYPINEHELEVRRDYQTAAIGNCEKLIKIMQRAMVALPVDVNKLLPYVDVIDKEVALLKGWRKANSKIKKRLGHK